MSPSTASYTHTNGRPLSIAELAERAKADPWDSQKPLKHWLRTAESSRSAGKRYAEQGDLENAFVELARAATIVLERLPAHQDYRVLLNSQQRHNMGLHGQEILDLLSEVKSSLVERYENWQEHQPSTSTQPSPYSRQPDAAAPQVYISTQQGHTGRGVYPDVSPEGRTPVTPASSASTPSSHRSRGSAAHHKRTPSPYRQALEDEELARRAREDAMRRDEERRSPLQPPITTTSPQPPSMGSIQYPSLMSQHQIAQGYTPSLVSMFHQPAMVGTSQHGLLLVPPGSASGLYSNLLPRQSMPVQQQQQQYGAPPYPHAQPSSSRQPPPPLPPKEPAHRRHPSSARIEHSTDPVSRDLKQVYFPRDCLTRFVSIAAINTQRNRETCGLLLGKDRGGRFEVTTLLIPKQHSTSDTCTMDEEELVLQFTEERSLITLGWRMLPESFAVVCAPKSTPNFGIFRLTDPPGLQTILDCEIKEAFHPHPEVPIYTDADKGHIQVRDLPLEIVDIRSD
ncbi:hypothetical protein EWM64_g7444 [Hericium alpestre]|uniref:Uncharacterized protein n=1 Tax=Hericium alpestre TaxID=135208 RepID=A0A4Y9ZSW2_9AGAM|nr:hypothetical protein EWM64_g7444 [Hericium alpestre]